MEKAKDKLVPLKNFARVRFGIKTGANEFFHLSQAQSTKLKIEKKFLQPVIFSLKEIKGYRLNKNQLAKQVIICDKTKDELKGTHLLKYIKAGEEKGFNLRPTCAQRGEDSWYMLGKDWDYAPLIFPSKVGERMPVFLNDEVFEDKKLYGVLPKRKNDVTVLGAILNSTLARFFIEFTCRQLTGAQAIADIDVAVVKALLVPNLSDKLLIDSKIRKQLKDRFEKLLKTDADSVFIEIASTPETVSLDKVKPERFELDKIIFRDILGLSEAEQLEVYRAVVDLVKSRLDKAKSVGKRNKKNGDAVLGDAMSGKVLESFTNGD